MKHFFVILISLFLGRTAFGLEITYSLNGEKKKKISLRETIGKNTRHIQIYNRRLREIEVFKAISVKKLLKEVLKFKASSGFDISFVTQTGYAPFIPWERFSERDAYLAFDRADGNKFVTIGKTSKLIKELGPLFLIWDNSSKVVNKWEKKFSWVYQVTGIEIVHKIETLEPHPSQSQTIKKGYKVFKAHCMGCHAVSGIGGALAGDLIQTKSFKRLGVKKYHKLLDDPKKFKIKNMPAFGIGDPKRKLKKKQLFGYLNYQESRPPLEVEKSSSKSQKLNSVLDNL